MAARTGLRARLRRQRTQRAVINTELPILKFLSVTKDSKALIPFIQLLSVNRNTNNPAMPIVKLLSVEVDIYE